MKILIAEDDGIARHLLLGALNILGHDIFLARDGAEAWNELQSGVDYPLVILDIAMPGLTGIELCRRIRAKVTARPVYIMLLASDTGRANFLEGLSAGANDYLTKPFDPAELRARVKVASTFMAVQRDCAERADRFERTLNELKRLEGFLPICAHCKSVRDENDRWQNLEDYLMDHTDAVCSHGICPICLESNLAANAGKQQLRLITLSTGEVAIEQ